MPSSQLPERVFASFLREVCEKRGITVTGFSSDWVFRLQRDQTVAFVFGYDFSLNSATAQLIAKDKSATSDLLAFHNVLRIEHRLVTTPQLPAFVPAGGNWSELLAYFERSGCDVVCKPNDGTGGSDVFRARTIVQLEGAIHRLLQRSRACCVSPYVTITNEYRVILVSGTPQVVYRKQRPALTGDGVHTVRELLVERIRAGKSASVEAALLTGGADAHVDLDAVLPVGEALPLDWRHNLGQGAVPHLEAEQTVRWQALTALASAASAAIGITTASIDIVDMEGSLLVLEINSGIMMEAFARASAQHEAIARAVYDRIVASLFDLPALE